MTWTLIAKPVRGTAPDGFIADGTSDGFYAPAHGDGFFASDGDWTPVGVKWDEWTLTPQPSTDTWTLINKPS